MPRVRVHQHVNPLSPYYIFTPSPIDLGEIFADANLPLHLDIGCARQQAGGAKGHPLTRCRHDWSVQLHCLDSLFGWRFSFGPSLVLVHFLWC